MRPSSSVGTVTYSAIRRRSERFRASTARQERQREERDHRDDDEHGEVRRDDHGVEPGLLERASVVRESRAAGWCTSRRRLAADCDGRRWPGRSAEAASDRSPRTRCEIGADLGEDRRSSSAGFAASAYAPPLLPSDARRASPGRTAGDLQADGDTRECSSRREPRAPPRGLPRSPTSVPVGEQDDGRAPEPLVGDVLGRLDERVVDVRAFGGLRRLGDGRGELFAVVVNSVSVVSSGPNTMTDTGMFGLRSFKNARAAAIAPASGAPFMLFEASISRIAPVAAPPGGTTASPVTGPPFSLTFTPAVVSVRRSGSCKRYARSGNPEPGDSTSFGAGSWPSASPGRTSAATAALTAAVRTRRLTLLRLGARRGR